MTASTASFGRVLRLWAPLASTWLMMAAEGPFLAAVIARLAEPRHNLAAYGVAYAVAILVEAPVIMMLSASTALVEDAHSFHKVRSFTYLLNAALTTFQAVLLLTPLWLLVAGRVIGLPEPVGVLTQGALLLLLPWPGAIGYRRFYQGILIRNGLSRRVAYGTVVRLGCMGITAAVLAAAADWPGAHVGAAALSAGVCAEAVASRLMSLGVVRRLRAGSAAAGAAGDAAIAEPVAGGGAAQSAAAEAVRRRAEEQTLTYPRILRFYLPLALTSIISLVAHPVVTFFMGRAPAALESLAVLPVVNSLVFIFRSLGLAYQEVGITLLAESGRNHVPIARVAALLAGLLSAALGVIAFSPLAGAWFRDLSGLDPALATFAEAPLRILVLIPALSVVLSLQRAVLVHARRTGPITVATVAELAGIVGILLLTTGVLEWPGAVGAAVAFVAGRLASNLNLTAPVLTAASAAARRPARHAG